MKTNVSKKVNVDPQLLNEIRQQVTETLAIINPVVTPRVFCAADLWQIHRMKKTACGRRR